jgi:uncharacterized repeat protein (TIGR01451 family)
MKPRSLAVFIGVIALLALALGVGWGDSTPTGPAAARDTSLTVNQGLGNAAGPAAQSLARAAHPGPPRRVGAGPKLPHGARRLRALSAATEINVDVMLAPSDEAALTAYAANVSSPGNALYHHYLTVDQFAAMFGPSTAAVSTVEASLRADGLTPGPLSANHLLLPVTATAKQFAAAFSTSFDQYQLAGGQVAFANTEAPLVSGAAAPYVSGIIGLDTLSKPQPLDTLSKPQPLDAAKPAPRLATSGRLVQAPHVVTGGPQPCPAAISATSGSGSYTADQVASAYNFSGLYQAGDEGAGVTVAIVEFEPNLASDITAYQQCYGTSATVKYFQEDGGAGLGTGPDPGTGSGEAVLDIENVIGLAPKATVDVYQAPLTMTGYIDEYTAIVDNKAVNVVSTSWGGCETALKQQNPAVLSAEDNLFLQAALEGQSVFAASGDDGSTDCAVNSSLAVDDPGSNPNVTSVGGTSLTSASPPAQTTWNVSSLTRPQGGGASGGGVSSLNEMPGYQSTAPAALHVINANSSGSPCGAASGTFCREVPDVSASADALHGYVIYFDGTNPAGGWFGGVGGTSAAAPLWAALAALTDASSTCAGKAIGFANPLLYQAAATNYAANFTDVTSGNNDYTIDGYFGGLYPAGTGYDMATGLGTPNGATLARSLCSGGGAANTVTVTNPGSQTTTVGATVSLPVTATDSAGATLTFTATGLPPGLSISSSGLISGSPSAAGAYPVTVTATDTANASGSAAFTITVNKAAQTISFAAPVAGMVGGTAALTGTGGGSGNPVVFSVDASSGAGVCSVSGNTVSYLAAGSCVIDANQAGNANFTAAPKVTQTIAVGQASQSISFTAPATGTVGGSATLSATGGGSGNPVTFSVDATSGSGVCSVSGSTVSYLAAGSCVIDANQAGNANYTAAPTVTKTITINAANQPQTISFTAPTTGTVGGSATLSATGGGSGNPVVFSVDGSSGSGVCSVSGSTVSYLAAGSCVIDANQAGNDSFSAAPTVTKTITVGPAGAGSQTISFTAPASGTVGGSATLSATGGGSGNPVTFSVDATSGTGVCSVSGSTVSYLAPGSCVIDANQAGNDSFSAAPTVTQTITVNAAVQAQSISFTPPASGTVGGSATLSATGGGSGNPVVFSVDGSSGSGVCSVSGSTVSYLAAGSCVIDANQAGNADFSAAPPVTQTITVGPGSQTISFTAPATGSVGGSATLTATGGGSGNPVVFSVDATSGSGVCSVSGSTVSYLAVGSCVIDANQAGDADYTAAPEVMQTITVAGAPAFVTDSPPLTATAGQPYDYTFTASGTPAPSYALASGTPSWLSVDASTGEVTGTPPSGTTSFSYSVTATNANGSATAGPFSVTVSAAGTGTSTKADVSAALTCPASLTAGDTGTCTLTVANAGPATAGNVVAAVRLPAALSEVSCTADCARHRNVFTWTTAALASGDSAQFAVTVTANAAGKVTVLAAAASQNCDPNPRNNISVQQITISRAPGEKGPGPGRYPGHGHPDRDGRGWPARRDGH